MRYRILFLLFGNVLIGLGIGLSLYINFGTDSLTALYVGFSNYIPLSYGTIYVLANCFFFLIVFLFDKKKINVGTVLNMTMNGYIGEFVYGVLENIDESPAFILRCVLLPIFLCIMACGVAMYMSPSLGEAPWDALTTIVTQKLKKPFRIIRSTMDTSCLIIGVLLGAPFGFASIILSFFSGPLIQFFRVRCDSFLNRHS